MNKRIFFFVVLLFFTAAITTAQVGISTTNITPDASSMLEVRSTNTGILIPRIALTTTTAAAPVTSPATSLIVYNTATVSDVTPGFYYWDGSKWVRLLSGSFPADAWKLTGNAGTVATTNFIGTTDAIAFVTRTNNTERTRILSAGNVLFNRTTALYATDLFEAQGNATFPDAINGYTDQVAGNGVFGGNTATTGAGAGCGVYGLSGQTGGSGVFGDGGVYTSGTVGYTEAGGYDGVQGYNQAATGAGIGCGVYGLSYQTGAAGVWGSGSTYTRGVIGTTSNATYAGVLGQNANADGIGIYALNAAASGTLNGNGLYAITAQSNGVGAEGFNSHTSGTGVMGTGNNATGSYLTSGSGAAFTGTAAGSFSKATSTTGTAVLGGGNNKSVYTLTGEGSGGAFTGATIGVYGTAVNAANDTWGGYFDNTNGAYAYVGGTTAGGTDIKISGSGTAATIVPRPDNSKAIMFCTEAPEILFQDYGIGKLMNGRAHIQLDPILVKNILVDANHPMKVFIQLESECNGVYVTNKTGDGFDVVELNNGQSNAEFSWSIIANRADALRSNGTYSKNADVRFPDAPLMMEKQEMKENSRKAPSAEMKIDENQLLNNKVIKTSQDKK